MRPPIIVLVILLATSTAACSEDIGLPGDAVEPFVLDQFRDPMAFDDVLAEAERTSDNSVILVADISACETPVVWAIPQADRVVIRYRASDDRCDGDGYHRAIFLIDESGANVDGNWDYTDGQPPMVIERAR